MPGEDRKKMELIDFRARIQYLRKLVVASAQTLCCYKDYSPASRTFLVRA